MMKYVIYCVLMLLVAPTFAFDIVNRAPFPITIKVNDTCSTVHWGKQGVFDSSSRTQFKEDDFAKACSDNKSNCLLEFYDSHTCAGQRILSLNVDTLSGVTKSTGSAQRGIIHAHFTKAFLLIMAYLH